METVFIFYLHQNIIQTRVQEEFSKLLASGSNHRDVLVEYYSDITMKHIVLMEKDRAREVIITDDKNNVASSSVENMTSLQNISLY